MSDFSMDVVQETGGTIIRMAGILDETVELALPAPLSGGVVYLEVGGVESINSLGVAKWLRFFDRLRGQASQIVVRSLSVALTMQASMISSFLEGAQVESFMVPYECESCDHGEETLFQASTEVPDSMPCPKCQGTMELDSDPEAYLAFR